jgi:hypothetical protein
MKICNIWNSPLSVELPEHKSRAIPIGNSIVVDLSLNDFQRLNPSLIMKQHFVIIELEFDKEEILIQPEMILEEVAVSPMVAREIIEASDSVEVQEDVESKPEIETEEQWLVFFNDQTKNSLLEFVKTKNVISVDMSNNSKDEIVQCLMGWVKENNFLSKE